MEGPQQPLLASAPAPPHYSAVETPLPYTQYTPQNRRKRSCCGTCCAWFCKALLGVVLLLFAFLSVFLMWPEPATTGDEISAAIPASLQVKSCVSGHPQEPTTVRNYHFSLPLHDNTTLVLSRYWLARPEPRKRLHVGGTLRITTATDLPPHTAYVVVVPNSLGEATVCSLVPKEGYVSTTSAFGVFGTGSTDAASVNMTLVLPASTTISGLQTSLPDFAYDIDDLVGAGVEISTAFITGGEQPISVKSISAKDRLLLSTYNASISAGFARSDVLDVSTGSSPTASPTHLNASISGTYESRYLRLLTANAPITAQALVTDGVGVVDAYTSNASLALTVLSPPADSEMRLRLRAVTTDASATVRLPVEYEGSFRLFGTKALVRERRDGGDKRRVDYYYHGPAKALDGDLGETDAAELGAVADGEVLTGAVYLSEEGMQRGWVSVVATGGGTRLVL
ncbi:hypothetical protein HMN09_00569300 [Mycena chlorophos]|uniref:Uncharacterized protein n=1 Tax=Mycena chlorophos TaxID=658473 RepID=A0A8H6WDR9_MYCCL|nr:hypothetical protein HMN09_00569300 [Mycena chlorophos]